MDYSESQQSALSNVSSNGDPEAEYQLGCYYYELYKQDKSIRKLLMEAVLMFGLARMHGCTEAVTILKQIYDKRE